MLHSWPAPLPALVLVVSPRLGLRQVSISCPFQINYLFDFYLEMETFLGDLGDALLLDYLFFFAYFELLFSKP
jgi:hypothetical protein